MKIAQVAPLIESVPPKLYGGTERIVSYLTEELVRQGHEVVLFASGDSETAAELVPCCHEALRLAQVQDTMPYNVLQLEQVRRCAGDFDILHFHTDYLHFPLARNMAPTTVTTMHGRLDLPDLLPVFSEYDDMPLVSISDNQRLPLPAQWAATIYTACRLTFTHSLARELVATWRSSAGYARRSVWTGPSKLPSEPTLSYRKAGLLNRR